LLGTLPVHLAHHTPYCHWPLFGSNPFSYAPMYCATAMAWRSLVLVSQNSSRTHSPCIHLGLVQPQLVLPHLQAMYYGEELFLMNWPSPLTTIELHALICNGHPPCINTPPMQNHSPSYTPQKVCQIPWTWPRAAKPLALKLPKAWWQSSSHSWDSHFSTSRTRF